jgi:hypothetical protein
VPGKDRSAPGVLARWWTWLQRLADDLSFEEWEERTAPANEGDGVTHIPSASLDEVLRGAAPEHSGGGEDGKGDPPGN